MVMRHALAVTRVCDVTGLTHMHAAFVTTLHVVMAMRYALVVTRVCVVTVLPHVCDGIWDDTPRRDGHVLYIGCYPRL